jgi:hypothetical protein
MPQFIVAALMALFLSPVRRRHLQGNGGTDQDGRTGCGRRRHRRRLGRPSPPQRFYFTYVSVKNFVSLHGWVQPTTQGFQRNPPQPRLISVIFELCLLLCSAQATVKKRLVAACYGCRRGGLRLPAPRPHEPHASLRANAAAHVPPHYFCGRCGSPLAAATCSLLKSKDEVIARRVGGTTNQMKYRTRFRIKITCCRLS